MNRRIIVGVLAGLMVPYLTTLAWTGTIHGEELRHEQQAGAVGKRRILLDRGGTGYYMDVEEYLPGVLARQMPRTMRSRLCGPRRWWPEPTYTNRWEEARGTGRFRRCRNRPWIWTVWRRRR